MRLDTIELAVKLNRDLRHKQEHIDLLHAEITLKVLNSLDVSNKIRFLTAIEQGRNEVMVFKIK